MLIFSINDIKINDIVVVLYQLETKDVLSEEIAYVVVNLMEGVTQFGSKNKFLIS